MLTFIGSLLCIWCGPAPAAASRPTSVIALNDAQFVGEDSALTTELSRRMATTSRNTIPFINITAEPYIKDIWEVTMLQRPNNTRKTYYYGQDPPPSLTSDLIMKMIEQSIYSTQYRLKEIDYIIRRYENDPRFRLGYAFRQIEEWELELHVIRSYATNASRPRNDIYKFRPYHHLIYYTHCVKRMIDITYTKDHIIDLANLIIDSQNNDEELKKIIK